MEIQLDIDEVVMVKQLYDFWQESITALKTRIDETNARQKVFEKCLQQIAQINGLKKEEFNPAEWEIDLKTSILRRKANPNAGINSSEQGRPGSTKPSS